jgi:hypothetical protein
MFRAFFNSNRPYYAGRFFIPPLVFLSGIFLLFFLFGAESKGSKIQRLSPILE